MHSYRKVFIKDKPVPFCNGFALKTLLTSFKVATDEFGGINAIF